MENELGLSGPEPKYMCYPVDEVMNNVIDWHENLILVKRVNELGLWGLRPKYMWHLVDEQCYELA